MRMHSERYNRRQIKLLCRFARVRGPVQHTAAVTAALHHGVTTAAVRSALLNCWFSRSAGVRGVVRRSRTVRGHAKEEKSVQCDWLIRTVVCSALFALVAALSWHAPSHPPCTGPQGEYRDPSLNAHPELRVR